MLHDPRVWTVAYAYNCQLWPCLVAETSARRLINKFSLGSTSSCHSAPLAQDNVKLASYKSDATRQSPSPPSFVHAPCIILSFVYASHNLSDACTCCLPHAQCTILCSVEAFHNLLDACISFHPHVHSIVHCSLLSCCTHRQNYTCVLPHAQCIVPLILRALHTHLYACTCVLPHALRITSSIPLASHIHLDDCTLLAFHAHNTTSSSLVSYSCDIHWNACTFP